MSPNIETSDQPEPSELAQAIVERSERALKHRVTTRRQAVASSARYALYGMLANPALTPNWNHVTDAVCPPRYAHIAVAYAEALVDELEKEGAADR